MTLMVFSCLRSRRLFKRRLAINIVASMLPKKTEKRTWAHPKKGTKKKEKIDSRKEKLGFLAAWEPSCIVASCKLIPR